MKIGSDIVKNSRLDIGDNYFEPQTDLLNVYCTLSWSIVVHCAAWEIVCRLFPNVSKKAKVLPV